jgi:two-component system CheB/CheR fusion protein
VATKRKKKQKGTKRVTRPEALKLASRPVSAFTPAEELPADAAPGGSVPRPGPSVAGIGASAGGLDALFFRDPEAWCALATKVIAPLVGAKEPEASLRAWCAGCATGEEPYSLGILLLEQLAATQTHCPVQIFATDVDEDALEAARQGRYPESLFANISLERLARFFTRVSDTSYQVRRQLREIVTFARHNIGGDVPFSKLDLVVCRNVLSNLEPDVQKRILELFHYALNGGGILLLGPLDTIGRNTDLFEAISTKWGIYERIGPTRTRIVSPLLQSEVAPAGRINSLPKLAELAQSLLLRRLAVAYVVINRNSQVLHFGGSTKDYFVQPSGPPTRDLLCLARPGLGPTLRVGVQRAILQNTAQRLNGTLICDTGLTRRVKVDVEPLNTSPQTDGLLLISFHDLPNPVGETLTEPEAPSPTTLEIVRHLEQELEITRHDLRRTIAELESSNEEIQSMNEELRSTNEELETSKEDLQSLNEELSTINDQLRDKVQELEAANNDVANLLNSTEVATVFLDTDLRIKRFTPAATNLFELIATDLGRPLGAIVKKFADETLLDDARQLLRDLASREQEVRTDSDRWCIRRVVPYRTRDRRMNGAVLTFVDITERKKAEDGLRLLAAIVEGSGDAILSKDLDGTIRTWNQGAERLYGYTAREAVGGSVKMLVPQDHAEEWATIMEQLRRGEHVEQLETERFRKDGRRVPVSLTLSPILNSDGRVVSVSETANNISRRRELEREVVEVAALEQRRIGQDLHDTVAQELTALSLLAGDLTEAVPTDPAISGKLAERLVRGLQRSQKGLRDVLRGLLPVSVDTQGLMAALSDLTDRIRQQGKVTCLFECPRPVTVADNLVATHLYLIAQEAVHNAVKHAQASNVRITLHETDARLILIVQDDGIGMPTRTLGNHGLGLRIMENRAAIIGAKLTIEPAKPRGTVVSYVWTRKTHEPERTEAGSRPDRR